MSFSFKDRKIAGIKRFIAREGLILIVCASLAFLFFWLAGWQSRKDVLSQKEIERYRIFQPEQRQTEGFDHLTAIPADSKVTRQDYEDLAKKELLRRFGYKQLDLVWDDEMEDRFGQIQGDRVSEFLVQRDQVKESM